jgi:hypothetical protein
MKKKQQEGKKELGAIRLDRFHHFRDFHISKDLLISCQT